MSDACHPDYHDLGVHAPTASPDRCKQEDCFKWSGDGNVCPCALFDLAPTPDETGDNR